MPLPVELMLVTRWKTSRFHKLFENCSKGRGILTYSFVIDHENVEKMLL